VAVGFQKQKNKKRRNRRGLVYQLNVLEGMKGKKKSAGARPTLSNRCRRTSLSAINRFWQSFSLKGKSEEIHSQSRWLSLESIYVPTTTHRARVKFFYQNKSGEKETEGTLSELVKYTALELSNFYTVFLHMSMYFQNFSFCFFVFDSRKNSIVLRTQLSVRVNGIMGK
jgi:hypothetical protein